SRREDQKFGGNRRWRQLQADFPELAEAARPQGPRVRSGDRSPADSRRWADHRDDEEITHRHWESWARSQTSSRRNYFYRGRASVMQDAESSSPKWCRPYGAWHHTDRGR